MAGRLLDLYRGLVRMAVRGTGLYELLTGLLILTGGEQRTSAPVYSAMRELWEPLGVQVHTVLGVWAIVAGLLVLVRRTSQVGLIVTGLWQGYIVVAFLYAVHTQPRAGYQGLTSAAVLAVVSVSLYRVRQLDRAAR